MAHAHQEARVCLSRGSAAWRGQLTRPKLLVTDLDGTLLDPHGKVHARDAEAIVELLDRGYAVSVCTGRMYSGTRAVARAIRVEGPVGCLDGSQVVDARHDRELLQHALPELATAALIDALDRHGPPSFLFAEDTVVHDDDGAPFLPYVQLWSERSQRVDRVAELSAWAQRKIAAVVSVGTEAQIRAAAEHIRDEAGSHVQAWTFAITRREAQNTWGMVVRAAGITKATALAWIAKHHGVSLDEVVAVGDWLNDIPMLKAAGHSYAMAQAPDAVKEAAGAVLDADAWRGGGIAEAAERAGML